MERHYRFRSAMQLRHMKTVQPAAEGEGVMQRVTALCWAPNNMRLAAVTTDRIVHLFDENGERRDKFSTKPADSKVHSRSPCAILTCGSSSHHFASGCRPSLHSRDCGKPADRRQPRPRCMG